MPLRYIWKPNHIPFLLKAVIGHCSYCLWIFKTIFPKKDCQKIVSLVDVNWTTMQVCRTSLPDIYLLYLLRWPCCMVLMMPYRVVLFYVEISESRWDIIEYLKLMSRVTLWFYRCSLAYRLFVTRMMMIIVTWVVFCVWNLNFKI